MPQLRRDEFDSVLEAIENGVQSIHISGQPGVGKSTFLERLNDELSGEYSTSFLYVREGNSPKTLTQDLLLTVRDTVGRLRSFMNSATGGSVGVGPVSIGLSVDDRARHLRKLAKLSDSVKPDNPLILFVDDVHKLGEPVTTRGYLREISSLLGENVYLITAGRLRYSDADLNIHLETFSHEETAKYVREEYSDVDSETIDGVYEKLEGHPYYLGLLTETTTTESTFELPETDARDFIEQAYLDSMSEAEEEFIRRTSGLAELDEEICSAVLENVSRSQARRILNSLSSKAVLTDIGRSEATGDRVFKVHDLFQEFLHRQLDNPEELHRAAFQYYAGKIFDNVEGSQTPSLEGFVFGLLANNHLMEIYGNEPEVHQLRAEIDRLDLEPADRVQFIFGYAPYSPVPEEEIDTLVALELDDYTSWLRGLEPEDEEDELWTELITLLFDIFRAAHRSDADVEFDESSTEIFESTIRRINELDVVSFFEEDDEEAAEIIPDMLRLFVHAAAYQDDQDSEMADTHLNEAYDVLGKYGLNRVAVEGFIENWRELAEEQEPGEQAEEIVERQLEGFFEQFDQHDVTRNTLIRMESDLYDELIELAQSAFTATVSESERLLEFVHDCGDSLEQADNPLFVAAWYSLAAHAYGMFAPEADSTKELEATAQQYIDLRIEYEENLGNPIYEIDDFEPQDVELPDVVSDITDGERERLLTE